MLSRSAFLYKFSYKLKVYVQQNLIRVLSSKELRELRKILGFHLFNKMASETMLCLNVI